MDAEAGFDIERRLVALARSSGPLRAALATIANWLVDEKSWERLGYARLSDYADERIGRSARSVYDLARVGWKLHGLPSLRAALIEGRLGWTKTRLIARVATWEDEERWIERACGITSAALSREVRKVDRGCLEANGLERDRSPSRRFEVECTPEVRHRWGYAQGIARRVNGGRVSLSECLEMIAAEALSALPIDPDAADAAEARDSGEILPAEATAAPPTPREHPVGPDGSVFTAPASVTAPLQALLEDIEHADAFELDRRLRLAVEMERRLDAQIGPLLDLVPRYRIFEKLGYAQIEEYVRERLGLEPSWGRALVRIERAARMSPTFAQAYRAGKLSALQATVLVPLVMAELSEAFIAAWIERAQGFTLRRLRDDVEHALLVNETDWQAWLRTGGLPEGPDAGHQAEDQVGEGHAVEARQIGAKQNAQRETCTVRAIVDADVARLARAVICTVRRRIEQLTGRLPTEGEVLGEMLTHVRFANAVCRSRIALPWRALPRILQGVPGSSWR